MKHNGRSVVVTGMGIQSPAGDTVQNHVRAWENGHTDFHMERQVSPTHDEQIVGRCPRIDKKILPDRKIQKAVMRRDVLGVIAVTNALKDAGVETGMYNPERFAMYVGAGSTQICDLEDYFPLLRDSYDPSAFNSEHFGAHLTQSVNPMIMLKTLMNNTLCYASIGHDIRGVNANFMDLQASGLRAIGEAYWSILMGRSDAAVCGGLSGEPDSYHIGEGIDMGYLFDARSFPQQELCHAIRPYDVERQGTILSEGCAFIVLEEEEHAKSRGAPILARLCGFGLASDATFALTGQQESGGLKRSLTNAIKQSSRRFEDIQWVFGQGNGSCAGDSSEFSALEALCAQESHQLNLTSVKPITGETTEAGAVISLMLGISAARSGVVPTMLNHTHVDTPSRYMRINSQSDFSQGKIGCVTARSFTGINCSLLFENVN